MMARKGTIFITVMLVSALMVLIGVSISNLIMQDVHMVRHLKQSTQAQYLAEAGVSRALAGLATAASFGAYSPPGTVTLGPGTYNITVSSSSIAGDTRWLISSNGTVGSTTRTATMEVRDVASGALSYALAAGTNIKLTANAGSITVKGDIHANNTMTLHGQNSLVAIQAVSPQVDPPIYGKATCSSTKAQAYKVIGNVTINDESNSGSGKPRLNMPTFNFGAFKDKADDVTDGGVYLDGDQTFVAGTSLTGGDAGITYVNGDATFLGTAASPCTITGGFVAKGNITLNNGNYLTQTATGDYPIFMSEAGSRIKLYGNFSSTAGVIVYATNDVQIETPGGGSSINGAVLAGGSFTITANDNLILSYQSIEADSVEPIAIEIVSWNR